MQVQDPQMTCADGKGAKTRKAPLIVQADCSIAPAGRSHRSSDHHMPEAYPEHPAALHPLLLYEQSAMAMHAH